MNTTIQEPSVHWTIGQVVTETGMDESTIHSQVTFGEFPRGQRLREKGTTRIIRMWLAAEVGQWMEQHLERVLSPVFCNQCTYMRGESRSTMYCTAPESDTTDLVIGIQHSLCVDARSRYRRCGTRGNLFEKLPEPESYISASRSSLSMMNRDSVESSTMTVATASAEKSAPKADSHIARAVSKRS